MEEPSAWRRGLTFTTALLLVLILAACHQAGEGIPTPTTGGGMVTTQASLSVGSPAPVLPTITPFPTMTPVFVLAPDVGKPVYPLSRLRILSPGVDSRLSSPFQPQLSVILGVNNTVEVELLDPGGQLLVKKILQYPDAPSGQRLLIQPMMEFEIPDVETSARLVVKTYDAFSRLSALTSCDLVLLQEGTDEVAPAAIPYEPFLLTEPGEGQIVTGGIVTVAGYARPISTSPIILALVDEKGVEISTRQLLLKADPAGAPVVFSTTLPYQVSTATPVRLILRQSSGSLPGPAAVFSLLMSIQ